VKALAKTTDKNEQAQYRKIALDNLSKMEKDAKSIPEDEWYDYAIKFGPSVIITVLSIMGAVTMFATGGTDDKFMASVITWLTADKLNKDLKTIEDAKNASMGKYPTKHEALKSIKAMRDYVNVF
jgi:hypothetical protein